MSVTDRSIRMIYRNYRGEVAERWVTPKSIRWGVTEWHPTRGWLMLAWDHDRGADREFSLADCNFKDLEDDATL